MDRKIWPWLLIAVSVAAGLFLRVLPMRMPYLDAKALSLVKQETAKMVEQSLKDRFPGLSNESLDFAAGKILGETLKKDHAVISRRAAEQAFILKQAYRDKDGRPYMAGIDSYYWLRMLRDLLERGHVGDKIVNGEPYDTLTSKPVDPATRKNIHLWLGFIFYKIGAFLRPGLSLGSALFLIPLLLSALIAVFAFFTAKRLGCNDIGSLMASIAINISPFLMGRMVSEWYDTDVYNVLFPLLIFGTFLYALDGKRKFWQRFFLCAASSLFVAFYASTWKGWWFIFDIIIISGSLFLLNEHLSRKEAKGLLPQGLSLGMFFAFSGLFVTALNGFSVWADFIIEPLKLAKVLQVTESTLWPNVYQTVAELARVKPGEIVGGLGGILVFFAALLGMLYMIIFERGLRDERFGFGFLCVCVWIGSTFYAAVEASRFTLLLVVPVGLAFGVAVSKFYDFSIEAFNKYLSGQPNIVLARCVLAGFLSLYPVSNINRVASQVSGPLFMMDSRWRSVLDKIRQDTPANAVINSWWDFGHWFTGVAQRRVLFDGMTQNTPYAYWMSSLLLTSDPAECLGIMRMINSSGNQATEELVRSAGLNLRDSIGLIRRCVRLDRERARQCLAEKIGSAMADKILPLLFPDKLPPVYLVISSDMPAKIAPISYIGNWDFWKVDLWFKQRKMSKQKFISYAVEQYGLRPEEAESRYLEILFMPEDASKEWFSSYLKYYSSIAGGREHDGMLYFDNGLVSAKGGRQAVIAGGNSGVPRSLFLMENGMFREIAQENSSLGYSGVLTGKGKDLKSFLCDTALGRSMLVRLYFFQAKGIDFLRLFDKAVYENGDAIYVYQVIWPAVDKRKSTSKNRVIESKSQRVRVSGK